MKAIRVSITPTESTIHPMHAFLCESSAVDREFLLDGRVDEQAVGDHRRRDDGGEGNGDREVDADAVEAAGDAEERGRNETEHEVVVANHNSYHILREKGI
jgi:hypothetical protein